MGADKTTTSTNQQATATPEERALLASQGRIQSAGENDQIAMNRNASNLVNQLLTGSALPGYLSGSMGINEQQTQGMVDQSLKDLYPMFQQSGILDSGVAASIASRTSGDIRNQNAQFNVQSLQQLLNLAIGGQASVQAPMNQNAAQLGNSLAGLRTYNGTSTVKAMNPFLKSFQQSLGQNLGNTGSEALKWAFA